MLETKVLHMRIKIYHALLWSEIESLFNCFILIESHHMKHLAYNFSCLLRTLIAPSDNSNDTVLSNTT